MSESRFGRAFTFVFPLPFCVAGMVALGEAARDLARGAPWSQIAAPAGVGAIFAAAGFGMIALFRWTRRRRREEGERRRLHPDEPWLWRADWAAGRIAGSNRARMGLAWLFAVAWNALSTPALFEGLRRLERRIELETLLILLFPAIGVALLVWALRATWRWKRYGPAHLVLDAVPAPVGGRLRGTVTVGEGLRAETVVLTLNCIRRTVSGSGKHRNVRETILSQDETRLDRFDLSVGAGETRIPVELALPRDAQPTDPETSERSRVLWRLEARAETPGIDWSTHFEVPVFRTAESDRAHADMGRPDPAVDPTPAEPPADRRSRVRIAQTPEGLELVFPAARNVGAILALLAFTSIWTAVVVFLATRGHATFFTLVFGFFDLLLLALLGQMLFLQRTVQVGPTAVDVTTRWLGFSRTKRIDCEDLGEVRTRIGMQSNNTPYYDVVLVALDGKTLTAGCSVADKAEAEWIAGELREAAGLLRREGAHRAGPRRRPAVDDRSTGTATAARDDVSRSA